MCCLVGDQPTFQSTPPARGATYNDDLTKYADFISIHAPREGGDRFRVIVSHICTISIHAPREGGDNKLNNGDGAGLVISIHAPREGGDLTTTQLL